MSGQTEKQVGWTVDTLKALFEARSREIDQRAMLVKESLEKDVRNLDRIVTITQSSASRAIDKAEEAIGARLALLNEFRGQAEENAKKYMSKDEYNPAHKAVVDKVDALQKMMYMATGAAIVIASLISYVIQVVIHGVR